MAFAIKPFKRTLHIPTRSLTPEEIERVPSNPPPIRQPKDRTPLHQRPPKAKTKKAKQTAVRIPRLEKAEKRSFTLSSMTAHAPLDTLYSVHERIGTGSMLHCEAHPAFTLRKGIGEGWLKDRAQFWLDQGYAVEWHDEQRWFVATHEDQPTVYAVLQEASNV